MTFRSLGIELKRIKDILELEKKKPLGIFLKRIFQINDDILHLRKQQIEILNILELDSSYKIGKSALKSHLPEIFEGKNTKAYVMHIHSIFQQCSPAEHKRLLDLLGFSESDSQKLIKEISTGT